MAPTTCNTPRAWSHFLSSTLDRPVVVRFGRARRQVIVAQEEPERLVVRMNAVFAEAPPDVVEAVSRWLRSGRRARTACDRLDDWIARVGPRLEPARSERLRTRGERHDLAALFEDVRASEFRKTKFPPPAPRITWGRRSSRRVRHSLQLGSFDPETGLIRIHPVLDQPAVPRFFVAYVVFHELLHAALVEESARARKGHPHHGPEFRRREETYANFQRALTWQEENLAALLRSARTGRPMAVGKRGAVAAEARQELRQLWLF